MQSAKIDPTLAAKLATRSSASFDLIVRVAAVNEAAAAALAHLGFEVRRSIHLVPSFAVSGPGSAVAALVEQPWVLAVEEDRPVRALEP